MSQSQPGRRSPNAKVRFGVALTGTSGRTALDTFCDTLGRTIGLEVEGVGVWQYHRLVEAMDVGDIDIAWLPPILALQAAIRGVVVPIALPVRGGASSYATALFTREGGSIATLADLKGVSAAWVDRQSTSGYLLIRGHLRTRGIDLAHAFNKDRFLGAHDAVARAVIEGTADVGATFVYLADSEKPIPLRAGWGGARVRVLATAGPIPSDVMAANAHLDRGVASRVQAAFLAPTPALRFAAFDLLRADSFNPPTPRHLEPLAALLPTLEEDVQRPSAPIWPREE